MKENDKMVKAISKATDSLDVFEVLTMPFDFPRVYRDVNKLLKPHGLRIRWRGRMNTLGDAKWIRVETLKKLPPNRFRGRIW